MRWVFNFELDYIGLGFDRVIAGTFNQWGVVWLDYRLRSRGTQHSFRLRTTRILDIFLEIQFGDKGRDDGGSWSDGCCYLNVQSHCRDGSDPNLFRCQRESNDPQNYQFQNAFCESFRNLSTKLRGFGKRGKFTATSQQLCFSRQEFLCDRKPKICELLAEAEKYPSADVNDSKHTEK